MNLNSKILSCSYLKTLVQHLHIPKVLYEKFIFVHIQSDTALPIFNLTNQSAHILGNRHGQNMKCLKTVLNSSRETTLINFLYQKLIFW